MSTISLEYRINLNGTEQKKFKEFIENELTPTAVVAEKIGSGVAGALAISVLNAYVYQIPAYVVEDKC